MWAVDGENRVWLILVGLFLLSCGIQDVCRRSMPVYWLLTGSIVVFLRQMVWLLLGKADWVLVCGGLLAGGIFFLVSRVTEEGFGYGDSWLILLLGGFVGIWNLITLLCISFLISGVAAMGMAVKQRKLHGGSLPFVPCLFCGYLGVLLL